MIPSGFLLDMGISPKLEQTLRSEGYNVKHVHSIGLGCACDSEILSYTEAENLAVVTSDTDMAMIVMKKGRNNPSVITLRLENPSADNQIQCFHSLLSSLPLDQIDSSLITVERERYRRRKLISKEIR